MATVAQVAGAWIVLSAIVLTIVSRTLRTFGESELHRLAVMQMRPEAAAVKDPIERRRGEPG